MKEIEEALLEGRVDLAVHSLKDLPAERRRARRWPPSRAREDPRDVLVAGAAPRIDALPAGRARRDLEPAAARPAPGAPARPRGRPIRGNVDTRLRKLGEGEYDAHRPGRRGAPAARPPATRTATVLDPDEMLPAVGQGTLGVEAREDDTEILAAAAAPDRRRDADRDPRRARVPRGDGRDLHDAARGVCSPGRAGAQARRLRRDGRWSRPPGRRRRSADAPESLGRRLAARLLAAGAAEIIRTGRVA